MKPSYMDATNRNKTIRFLNGIGDALRLQILDLLGRRGRMSVNEIASNFQVSRPAISHHLKVLKDADIVQYEKIGQEVYYWINQEYIVYHLRNLAEEIDSFF